MLFDPVPCSHFAAATRRPGVWRNSTASPLSRRSSRSTENSDCNWRRQESGAALSLMTPIRRHQRSFCTRQGPPPIRIWSRSATATCWPSPSGCRAWFNLTPQDRCLNVSPGLLFPCAHDDGVAAAARRRQRRVSRQCLERRSFGMAGRPATHVVLGRSHAAPLGPRKGSAATGRTHHAFAALHLICGCAACRRCA